MANEYKINLRRFNGVDYDIVYPSSTADMIKYSDGTTLDENRTKSITFTIPISAWVNTTGTAWACTISVSDVTERTNGILGISNSATEEQYTECLECGLRLVSQGDGTITISARYRKPVLALPLEIIVTGVNP